MVNWHQPFGGLSGGWIHIILDENVACISVQIEKPHIKDGDLVYFIR